MDHTAVFSPPPLPTVTHSNYVECAEEKIWIPVTLICHWVEKAETS